MSLSRLDVPRQSRRWDGSAGKVKPIVVSRCGKEAIVTLVQSGDFFGAGSSTGAQATAMMHIVGSHPHFRAVHLVLRHAAVHA